MTRTLRDRFPMIARLERSSEHKRIPVVLGTQTADCGAACLAMVLHHLGRDSRLDEVKSRIGIGRDGATAAMLLDAGRTFGLRGRAVRLDLDNLGYLSRGAILHWQMQHFVVLDRVSRRRVTIVDPAHGRETMSLSEFGKNFTGVALVFEKTSQFTPGEKRRSIVWGYVRQIATHSRLLGRVVWLSVFAQLCWLVLPMVTGAVIDRIIPRADLNLLHVVVLGASMLTVCSFVAGLLRAKLLLHLQTNLDLRMTLDFLDHLLRLPFSFFQVRQAGDLMMRLNSNSTIREILTSTALSGLLDGVLVFAYLAVLLMLSPALGLLIVLLGALRISIYVATRRRHRALMSRFLKVQAAASNYQVEVLSGIETLKSSGAERIAVTHSANLFVDVLNVGLERGQLNASVQSLLTALSLGSSLAVLLFGAHLVMTERLSLGSMLAMSSLAAGFLGPLSSLVSTALSLQTLGSYLERVDDVLTTKPEYSEGEREAAPALSGKMEVSDLSFQYSASGPLILRNVSVTVEPGCKIGIVGSSGSGKSTLARLLAGLYEPGSGDVLYDDRRLRDLDLPSLRRQLGFVPQHPFIFGTTIRRNIGLAFPDLPLQEIERAAALAGIHTDISSLPLRYDTPVAAGGASLSGGQRQRIALARALASRPAIIVLDEATSHLDALTEAQVHANLRSLKCTQVVIAHRLSTIIGSDVILVMDHGAIVERGTHESLTAMQGIYARLYDSQRENADGHHADG